MYPPPSPIPGCQKLHSEKALLLSSRVIIYLSKQESSQHTGGPPGVIIARQFGAPEMPPVKMEQKAR